MTYVLKRTVSSTEASLCRREAGEKGKESARGTMGRGRRESSRLFSLPIVPRAPSIFRWLLFLLGYPASVILNPSTVFSTFDMDKLGKIQGHHWKKRLKISELAKFESGNYAWRERRYNAAKLRKFTDVSILGGNIAPLLNIQTR